MSTASISRARIEQTLAPSLRSGQIVIMDNLSIHQGAQVRQAIEAKGCQLLFLPAYSPHLSPIEEAFSTLKMYLRRLGIHTHETLFEAIAQALLTVATLRLFKQSHHPVQKWMSLSLNLAEHRSST